jgi:hypothetical protein
MAHWRRATRRSELVKAFGAAVDIHAHEFEPDRKRGATRAEQLIEERSDDLGRQLGQHAAHAPLHKPKWFHQSARERAADKTLWYPLPKPGPRP